MVKPSGEHAQTLDSCQPCTDTPYPAPSRLSRRCMPLVASHKNAAFPDVPTTIEPSSDVPVANESTAPGSLPSGSIAPFVHLTACRPLASFPYPTMIEPSRLICRAELSTKPPGRSPRPCIPPALVHRNASSP